MKRRVVLVLLACSSALLLSVAQETASTSNGGTGSAFGSVPRLIKYLGIAKDQNGKPMLGIIGITFALYKDEQRGAALWLETQNVHADASGHYSVQLGAAQTEGIPLDVFTSGEARWLGVQIAGQAEQSRVLLVSAPYALKAADAETLGGFPPSAFVFATSPSSNPARDIASATSSAAMSAPPAGAVTGSGSTGFAPLWTSSSNLGNSVLFQSGSGSTAKVGVNTTTPAATLDVKGGTIIEGLLRLPTTGTATSSGGKKSQAQDFVASSFNSGINSAVQQTFRWQAEPAGNNTSSPSGTLNLLFGSGNSSPSETGLQVSSQGIFTFASGQTFPGTGTITGVNPGTDLTGGGTSGIVTLNLDTTKVPELKAANTFTGNQTVNGSVSATQLISNAAQGTAPLQITSTTLVPNLNANLLGGFPAGAFQPAGSYATLGTSNTFIGSQNVTATDSGGAGLRVSAFNQSTSGQSYSVFAAYANNGAVATQFYSDGLGTGPLGTPGGYFGTYTNHPMGFFTANLERMVITNSGSVGIGTRAPAATLDVAGSFRVNGDTPMSSNPRMTFSGFLNGDLGFLSGPAGGFFIPDRAITVTRITVRVGTQGFGCNQPPSVNVDDFSVGGSTVASVSIPNSASTADSGPIAVNFPGGDSITIDLTPTSGCGLFDFSPHDAFVNVQYVMQ